jgi:uncharacterized protein
MVKARHTPVRTCVACRKDADKGALMRIVRRPDGTVARDETGRMAGRGAYLHADPGCVELARKRHAVDRALRVGVPAELWAELAPEVSNSPSPA